MNGRMIETHRVDQMFRDGTLWHGMELEFSDTPGFEVPIGGKLIGHDPDADIQFSFKRLDGFYDFAGYARFTMPELKRGDPIIVNCLEPDHEAHAYFHSYNNYGRVVVYQWGFNNWVDGDTATPWALSSVRVPTPDELEAAGLDRNWFAGRRGIPQNG